MNYASKKDTSHNLTDSRMSSFIQNKSKPEKPSYKQFFESEDEEEQSTEKHRGRPRKRQEEEDSQDYEESDEEEIEDDEDSKEWDDKCYFCQKGGNVLCCETCSHVAHLTCLGLKKNPEGDWHCEECLIKQSQRRTTRGQTQQQNKGRPARKFI